MNIICSNSLSVKHKRIKMPYFLLFHCYNDKKNHLFFGKKFHPFTILHERRASDVPLSRYFPSLWSPEILKSLGLISLMMIIELPRRPTVWCIIVRVSVIRLIMDVFMYKLTMWYISNITLSYTQVTDAWLGSL